MKYQLRGVENPEPLRIYRTTHLKLRGKYIGWVWDR